MRFFWWSQHQLEFNDVEKKHENKFNFFSYFFKIKLYRVVAPSSFSYLQTLPGTPSMPHEFLNKSISRILFISASCTAIILLLWLHPLCHLSPSVPFTGQHQIFIASLFFNKLSTPIPQPFPPLTPFRLFPFTSEKGPFFLVISLLHPFKLFPSCNTLISIRILPLLCIVILLVSFFPALCPVFLSLMPLSRTLLLPLRSACWNTQWRKGVGEAAVASVWLGGGVWEAAVGAILTSGQQQWWWSSARCSLAPRVPYGPPSPLLSSPGPGRKKMKVLLLTWSDPLDVGHGNMLPLKLLSVTPHDTSHFDSFLRSSHMLLWLHTVSRGRLHSCCFSWPQV